MADTSQNQDWGKGTDEEKYPPFNVKPLDRPEDIAVREALDFLLKEREFVGPFRALIIPPRFYEDIRRTLENALGGRT